IDSNSVSVNFILLISDFKGLTNGSDFCKHDVFD
ncbi:MAG: hypothetical protein ACD_79C00259G0001, partial [uncultured bacterium]